jgi:hypothetical protein
MGRSITRSAKTVVGDAHETEDHREARGQEEQDRAEAETVEDLGEERGQAHLSERVGGCHHQNDGNDSERAEAIGTAGVDQYSASFVVSANRQPS